MSRRVTEYGVRDGLGYPTVSIDEISSTARQDPLDPIPPFGLEVRSVRENLRHSMLRWRAWLSRVLQRTSC